MLEMVFIPTILIFSLGFLLWDFTDDSENESQNGQLPDEEPVTFINLTDGADYFDSGDGNQAVFAGDGDDSVTGGAGDDQLNLGDGDDISFLSAMMGGIDPDQYAGDDIVHGDGGNDDIADSQGSNMLFGDDGDDTISGLENSVNDPDTPDLLDGGIGADILFGDDGDTMIGGDGVDQFFVVADANDDNPAIIRDYEPNEMLILQLPVATGATTATYQLSADNNDIEVLVLGQTLAILEGFIDLNAVNASVQLV